MENDLSKKILLWGLFTSLFLNVHLQGQTQQDSTLIPTVSVDSQVVSVQVEDPTKAKVIDFLYDKVDDDKVEDDFTGLACPREEVPAKFVRFIPQWRNPDMAFRRVINDSGLIQEANIKFYEYDFVKNILVISDGKGKKAMAERLAEKMPHTKIIKTDLYKPSELTGVPDHNILKIYMSNTESFPLPDNAFELIVLKRGICECVLKDKSMCCGPSATIEGRLSFLKEVVRVLNKNVVNSVALLHANEEMIGLSAQSRNEWLETFETMKSIYGDRLSFHLHVLAHQTIGVMVRVEKK